MEWDIPLLLYALLIGLCAGAMAGFMSGLAGVGGGLIYVPVFYLTIPNSSGAMALSIFASMLAVAVTSFFSAYKHWQLGHIHMPLMHLLWPSLLLGATLGLWSTLILPELYILMALAALNAWVAYDYGRVPASKSIQSFGLLRLLGLPISYLSGLLGIAGGTMLVPLFRRFVNLKEAVGTSALCGAIMAASAVVINVATVHAWQKVLYSHTAFLLALCVGILCAMPFTLKRVACLHDSVSETRLRFWLKCMFALIACMFLVIAWLK